jgi:hypothetical protein
MFHKLPEMIIFSVTKSCNESQTLITTISNDKFEIVFEIVFHNISEIFRGECCCELRRFYHSNKLKLQNSGRRWVVDEIQERIEEQKWLIINLTYEMN